jgi:hypothetical protein
VVLPSPALDENMNTKAATLASIKWHNKPNATKCEIAVIDDEVCGLHAKKLAYEHV